MEPTTYKVVTVGDDGHDSFSFLVVPHWVSAQEVQLAEAGISDEPYDCLCEAYSFEAAKMIARLVNEHNEKAMTLQ